MRAARLLGVLSVLLAPACSAEDPKLASRPVEATPEQIAAARPAADSCNEFAFSFLRTAAPSDQNLFFSPLSLSTALTLTWAGARGETAAEMAAMLHLAADAERVHQGQQNLMRLCDGAVAGPGQKLTIANGMWLHKDYPFLPDYLALGRDRYLAELAMVDFQQTENARQQINRWVSAKTGGLIPELFSPGVIVGLTRLVIANAIYFKGVWVEPFDPEKTKPGPFTLADGSKRQTPFMNRRGRMRFAEAEGVRLLELPYRGEAVSMVVLMPADADGADRPPALSELEGRLSAARLTEWLGLLSTQEVVLALPRFKMRSTLRVDEALQKLGMREAFGQAADLSGMDGRPGWLYVSAVVHEAYVDVNEEGTEAAAATGVVVTARAAPIGPVEFRADRPFLFLLLERRSGAIVMMGRMAEPAAE